MKIEMEHTQTKEMIQSTHAYLAGYSEVELRQMYFDGEITKAEYDEEVISRVMEA